MSSDLTTETMSEHENRSDRIEFRRKIMQVFNIRPTTKIEIDYNYTNTKFEDFDVSYLSESESDNCICDGDDNDNRDYSDSDSDSEDDSDSNDDSDVDDVQNNSNENEENMDMTGIDFKRKYSDVKFYKLTEKDFTFNDGLNVDQNSCDGKYSDGLYFCGSYEAYYDGTIPYYIWNVEIPDDARVNVFSIHDVKMYKADKIILKNKRRYVDFIVINYINELYNAEFDDIDSIFNKMVLSYSTFISDNNCEEYDFDGCFLTALDLNVKLIEKLPESAMSYKIRKFIASDFPQYMHVFKNLSEQQLEHCIILNSLCYQYINKEQRTTKLAELAVNLNPEVIEFIPPSEFTPTIIKSIENFPQYYKFIPNEYRTIEMTRRYLRSDNPEEKYIDKCFMKDQDISRKVVELNGCRLKDVPYKNIDYNLCQIAVKRKGAYAFIPLEFVDQDIFYQMLEVTDSLMLNLLNENYNEKFINLDLLYRIMDIKTTKKMEIMEALSSKYDVFAQLIIDNIFDIITSTAHGDYPRLLSLIHYVCNKTNKSKDEKMEIIINAIKNGLPFCDSQNRDYIYLIPYDRIDEIVAVRGPAIMEQIPKRYRSDKLYITCMKKHGMTLDQIPEEYHTSDLIEFFNTKN